MLFWAVTRLWPGDGLRAYLIPLSAFTLPHALLVFWSMHGTSTGRH